MKQRRELETRHLLLPDDRVGLNVNDNDMTNNFKAALFDLDGVVFDTEPQYTLFWKDVFKRYFPDSEGLAEDIKGSTLVQIYDRFFKGEETVQREITEALERFEQNMDFLYVPGVVDFLTRLRSRGVLTAVVTSSNIPKMNHVYASHPEFKGYFDDILTSEDFAESKPSPDCYLRAAARFSLPPTSCVVFEDSFNGLRSGRDAGMYVVGLATTNSIKDITPLCDEVMTDYLGM